MARYTGAVCRLCRREGLKLFLKGQKCYGPKCTFTKRSFAPGQHGSKRIKLSNYGLQLREKQKLKRMYGVLEKQFRRYFEIASKSKGVTGRLLLQMLEKRLDNAVYRLGWASSRASARQIVQHNFILINSKPVNIPSYLIKKDDTIGVAANEKMRKVVKENMELTKDRGLASWLELNAQELKAKVLKLPEKEDIQQPIQEQLVVELYSK